MQTLNDGRFLINSALLKEAYIMLRCGFNEQFFVRLVNYFDFKIKINSQNQQCQ
jgi:hypothetical protein